MESNELGWKMADPNYLNWADQSGGRMSFLLLDWFDRQKRDLPWRRSKDPYRVWLSEIMLQQTQVATVIPFFERFLQSWPRLDDLANAGDEPVLKAWEGLGYYSRARNLLAAARLIRDRHGGVLPASEKELLALPGIGEYTAAAIGSIAFSLPAAAVDGNIVRVFARLSATPWDPTIPAQRREVRQLAERLLPRDRAGDFNEALMDLGATICLPRQPECAVCPVVNLCTAHRLGRVSDYPVRPVRKSRPAETKIALVLIWKDSFHVSQRPEQGLLAGLYQFDWLSPASVQAGESVDQSIARLYPGSLISSLGDRIHNFSHKQWRLSGYAVQVPVLPAVPGGKWVDRADLQALPLPTALNGFREKALLL